MIKEESNITLMNYKEPLKPIESGSGFGYYGVLMATEDGEKVQCHICGEFLSNLGNHIGWNHNITAKEYRQKFELAKRTALVSEKERQARKERMLTWIESLSEEKKKKYQEDRIRWLNEARLEYNPKEKLTLETRNKRGSCPDQIIQKVKEVAEKLGHSPSYQEMVESSGGYRYVRLATKIFGTWNETLRLSELPESKGKNRRKRKIYTKEELIDYIKRFFRINGKIPTASDCRRGLLPHDDTYRKFFGGLASARKVAGVY